MKCKCQNCLKYAREQRRNQLVSVFSIAFLVAFFLSLVLGAIGPAL